ncbi:MAG: RHS repeat-associated core domain-containing protein [Armatimonadetes bacterium]|nr:RHS repeat-associated core domain-containing protein [Armatimonadota bacterium]
MTRTQACQIQDFLFSAAGRTTSVVTSAGTTSLTYDYESRLTSVTGPGITASYTYNGLDTRVGKTENGSTQVYKRDGVYVTDDVLSDSSAFYTPGVSERRAGTTSYLHGGLKNQTRQTNSSQTTTATRTYDAFGNVTSSSGTWNGLFGNAGAFGYQEDATGLKLLGHRYYDSSLGRFITRDPAKDGRNWYAYCGNDPLNWVDPSGFRLWVVVAIEPGGFQGSGSHAMVGVWDDVTGQIEWWGFYGDGYVQDEKNAPSKKAKIFMKEITKEKAKEVRDKAKQEKKKGKQGYKLRGKNCADFVFDFLQSLGLIDDDGDSGSNATSGYGFSPKDFAGLLEKQGWRPAPSTGKTIPRSNGGNGGSTGGSSGGSSGGGGGN